MASHAGVQSDSGKVLIRGKTHSLLQSEIQTPSGFPSLEHIHGVGPLYCSQEVVVHMMNTLKAFWAKWE